MAGLDEVLARVTNDPAFADAIRLDALRALRDYRLAPSELARLERALGLVAAPPAPLFRPVDHPAAGRHP